MAEGSGQNVKKQRRTPTIGIKLAAADFVRFNEYCRFEGKNRSEMARKAILFYMEAQQRGSEEAKESLLEKRLRKMEDRLAKMISRTMIDVSFRRPCHQISKVLVTNDTKSVRKWCGEEFFLTDFQKSLSPGSTSMCVEALLKPFLQKYRKGSEL